MKLTLALPALNYSGGTLLPPPDTPALNTLLRFGVFSPKPAATSAFYASYLWQGSLAEHAKRSLGIALAQPAVFASPVAQQLGMNSASMAVSPLSAQEAQTLCKGLNIFYAGTGWRFHAYRPDLWLAETPDAFDWQVPCILDLPGMLDGSIRADGADAKTWLQSQTEIQMWLHDYSQRHPQQPAAANSVWLWPDLNGTQTDCPPLAADSAWASAYAGPRTDAPHDFAAWQRLIAETPVSDRHILFLDDLAGAAQTGDTHAYRHIIETWDKLFFAPAWQALQQGRLDRLAIATCGANGGELQIKAKAGRAFWKRRRLFAGQWV